MTSTPPPDESQSNNPYLANPPQPPPRYSDEPLVTAPGQIPGRTLGVVGLILSFFTGLIGMVVSIIAFRQSRKAGVGNVPALIGIVIGGIETLIGVIVAVILITLVASAPSTCANLGPGIHNVNGVTYTCS